MPNSENGKETFLSEQERLDIIRTVDQARDSGKLLIAGIDCPAATKTLRLATRYVEAGEAAGRRLCGRPPGHDHRERQRIGAGHG